MSVSQVMRIASTMPEQIKPIGLAFANAADHMPWISHSPEAMSWGARSADDVATALQSAREGQALLRQQPIRGVDPARIDYAIARMDDAVTTQVDGWIENSSVLNSAARNLRDVVFTMVERPV